MASYLREPVDDLPFSSEAKSRRYATERYVGAVGRNWWTSDPSLQRVMRRYLGADGLAWAAPHLEALGALMGGADRRSAPRRPTVIRRGWRSTTGGAETSARS